MPRQSVVDSPPPMPDLRASHVAEGQPPRQAPPALPTEAPAGSRRREAAAHGGRGPQRQQPSQQQQQQQQQRRQQPSQQQAQQQQQQQQQPSQRLPSLRQPQQQQLPQLRQTAGDAAPGTPRGMPTAAGCVTMWTSRRLVSFLAGLGIGVLIPLALASLLWGAQSIGSDEKNATGVSAEPLEPANSTLWERTKAHAEDNPVNTVTGAVLFASLFFVWAHGGGTEIAWVSKALSSASSVATDAAAKRRSVTTEVLHQKSKAVGWGAAVWAFLGAIVGASIVLAVLSSTSRRGGTMFLSALLGAGTLGPLGANIGSQLEAVDKAMSGGLNGRHWLSAIQAYSKPSRCLASCSRAVASLPCWCGMFKVPGPEVDEQGKPIMVSSPRMLVTWIGVVFGAASFLGVGIALGATVSDSKEATLEDFLGYAARAEPVDDSSNGTSAAGGPFNSAVVWVRSLDEQLAPHFRQLRRERDALFENDMTQVLLLALCSLIWDVFVIYYHLVTAPHPKFRLRFIRRLSIYTHIWAGVAEILISVLSFVLYCEMAMPEGSTALPPSADTCTDKEQERSLLLTYAHVFCSVAHIVTAAYQTPQVFGMQLVMVPAYSAVVLWKAVCVMRLALDPSSLWLLLQLFFVHHIYVWCRAMHVIFDELGIFTENRYSVSIMFAGLICGPICLGPAANVAVIAVVALVGLLRLPYKPREEQQEWRVEKRSNMLLNERYRTALRVLAGGHTEGLYNLEKTADASQHIDASRTIYAPPHTGMTVTALNIQLGSQVEPGQAIATLSPVGDGAAAGGATPSAGLGNNPSKNGGAGGGPGAKQTDQERARLIFEALDDDGDGLLQQEEVVALLLSWGIPYHEALECFRSYDVEKLREVTFEQFFNDWEPVWRFQLSRVDEAVKQFFHFSEAVATRAAVQKQNTVLRRNTPRGDRP